MDIRIQGSGPTAPFLSARGLFETEHDLTLPVYVQLREDLTNERGPPTTTTATS